MGQGSRSYIASSLINKRPYSGVYEPDHVGYKYFQVGRLSIQELKGPAVCCFLHSWHDEPERLLLDLYQSLKVGEMILVFEFEHVLKNYYQTESFEACIDQLAQHINAHISCVQQRFLQQQIPKWFDCEVGDSVLSICLSRQLERGSVKVDSFVDFTNQ